MNILLQILHHTWHYAREAAPWLIVGFLFAGLLKAFVPQSFMLKHVGARNIRSIIMATLIGIPLPLCSCGVIPAGIGMYKQGASKASTLAFFIATPATSITTILLSLGMLGVSFTVAIVAASFIVAVGAGILAMFFLKDPMMNHPKIEKVDDHSGLHNIFECEKCRNKFKEAIKTTFSYGFVELVDDIGGYIILGLLVAAAIATLIPPDVIGSYLDGSLLALLLVVLIGTPMYICSTSSIPFVAVLLAKGMHPAAALVFLIAGPATNVSTILAIGKGMGKKTAFLYVMSIIILTVTAAYVFKLVGWL